MVYKTICAKRKQDNIPLSLFFAVSTVGFAGGHGLAGGHGFAGGHGSVAL